MEFKQLKIENVKLRNILYIVILNERNEVKNPEQPSSEAAK